LFEVLFTLRFIGYASISSKGYGLVVNNDFIRNYPENSLASHVLGYTGAITPDELGAYSILTGGEDRGCIA
jgi:cell division protein FtsI/penicillin-binding protein 2